MNRPLPPLFFVGVFLLILIAAVLMLAPRAAIALQLALVQKGNAVGLRLTCVKRVRAEVTAQAVAKAQAAYAEKTLDALVGSITSVTKDGGPEHRLVTTPEGRILTRLVLTSGEWLAEDAWFLAGLE